jgi:hypothetical protein
MAESSSIQSTEAGLKQGPSGVHNPDALKNEPGLSGTGSHVFEEAYENLVAPVLHSRAASIAGTVIAGVAAAGAGYYMFRGHLNGLLKGGEQLDAAVGAAVKQAQEAGEVRPSAQILEYPSRLKSAQNGKIPISSTQEFGGDAGVRTSIQFPENYAETRAVDMGSFGLDSRPVNDNLPSLARVPLDWRPPAAPSPENLIETRQFPGGVSHESFSQNVLRVRFAGDSTWTKHTDGTEVSVDPGGLTRIFRPDGKLVGREHLQINASRMRMGGQSVEPPPIGLNEELVTHWSSADRSLTAFSDGSIVNINPRQETVVRLPNGQPIFLSDKKLNFQTVRDTVSGIETTYFSNGARHVVTANGITSLKFEVPTIGGGSEYRFDSNTGKLVHRIAGSKTTTWRSGFEMNELDDGRVYFRDQRTSRFLHLNSTGLLANSEADIMYPVLKRPELTEIHAVQMQDDGIATTLLNRARIVEKFNGELGIIERGGRELGTVDGRGVLSSGVAGKEPDMDEIPASFRVEMLNGDAGWVSWDDGVTDSAAVSKPTVSIDQFFERSASDANVLVLKPTTPEARRALAGIHSSNRISD